MKLFSMIRIPSPGIMMSLFYYNGESEKDNENSW